ncbi:probable low-specificity L-threonine aldolase 2 [Rana temporaria]|uniref:probable low-specificity L-threonine aldolase 2 n=1 Tax=Rana temporaria TaxID=8407 RepID=UPI001AAD59FE|nr:probable low-specificity L-threonine aldolase 2 [Rana temporaria]XP_040186974.1 probable low-specificity L-threonine aldolase 2 [Rana temporaria]
MYTIRTEKGGGETAVVDLRSDAVSKPCAEMRRAMAEAEVGDDFYGEDPTVNEIQRHAAQLFKTEDALFVSSGTMGNLIAVIIHCRKKGSEVLLGDESHMYFYEQGSMTQMAGMLPRPVRTLKDGRLDLQDLESKIQHGNPDVQIQLICLENTHNRMGGRVLPLSYMKEVRDIADRYGLKVHLDGARLINAAMSLGVETAEIVKYCDSVALCLSKGLGAPAGSLLGGTAEFVAEARQIRKILGGGMRQTGVLAAPGLVALKHAQKNLMLDHQNAKTFAKAVQELDSPLCLVDPAIVDTNIVLLSLPDRLMAKELCEQLSSVTPEEQENGRGVVVKGLAISPRHVRLVWHRDLSAQDIQLVLEKLKSVLGKYSNEAA